MRDCPPSPVKYDPISPFRYALHEFACLLDTFAFGEGDFAFIDVAFGPLTGIVLSKDTTCVQPTL